jgi:hypothetical protein
MYANAVPFRGARHRLAFISQSRTVERLTRSRDACQLTVRPNGGSAEKYKRNAHPRNATSTPDSQTIRGAVPLTCHSGRPVAHKRVSEQRPRQRSRRQHHRSDGHRARDNHLYGSILVWAFTLMAKNATRTPKLKNPEQRADDAVR